MNQTMFSILKIIAGMLSQGDKWRFLRATLLHFKQSVCTCLYFVHFVSFVFIVSLLYQLLKRAVFIQFKGTSRQFSPVPSFLLLSVGSEKSSTINLVYSIDNRATRDSLRFACFQYISETIFFQNFYVIISIIQKFCQRFHLSGNITGFRF